jgi:ABC-type methionine transport system permease subunit
MPVVTVAMVALLIVVVQGLQLLGDALVRRISNK